MQSYQNYKSPFVTIISMRTEGILCESENEENIDWEINMDPIEGNM